MDLDLLVVIAKAYNKSDPTNPIKLSDTYNVLTPNIIRAQEIEIQQILGTPLYQDILLKVSGNTLNSVETTLVRDYIFPCLVEYSVYYAMPSIWAKLENSSVINRNPENALSVDLPALKYRRGDIKNSAEFLGTRIVNFLCDQSNSFPLYTSNSNDLYATHRIYDSGLVFDDRYTLLPNGIDIDYGRLRDRWWFKRYY
jgi:hypothetical protein